MPSPNPTALEIGTDYLGTLTGVAFDGVPGDAGVDVAWTLYDAANQVLGSGVGVYVSAGVYTLVIPAGDFDAQAPYPSAYKSGRVHVALTRSGVRGSLGQRLYFGYPDAVSS
jgi:hypothetical protein